MKRREMPSQIHGGGEASPKVPKRARLPPQRGARGLLSSTEGVWKRFWRRQFAGAALVWCAGLGPGSAAEGGGAGPCFGKGGGGGV